MLTSVWCLISADRQGDSSGDAIQGCDAGGQRRLQEGRCTPCVSDDPFLKIVFFVLCFLEQQTDSVFDGTESNSYLGAFQSYTVYLIQLF